MAVGADSADAEWYIVAMTRRIVIARHGQTAWNALGKLQGHTDIELDDVGRDQARTLATLVGAHAIVRVWTSDLSRARQTGEIVATAMGLPEPLVEPELRERRFGVFEGLTRDECAAQHPDAWRAWLENTTAPPGGEPREDAVARMDRALRRIAGHGEGTALVVSHGGVMRLWLMEQLGRTVPLIKNGTIYVAELGDRFRVLD
ncbi:MAG: histidine phosphatase family protein [Kofleriaceae bacterium]